MRRFRKSDSGRRGLNLSRQRNSHAMRASRHWRTLRVEPLEDRRLLSAGRYFAWTEYGGTFFDAEKEYPDDTPNTSPPPDISPSMPGQVGGVNDDYMCWAASASNALAWTGWGFHGTGLNSPDDMFDFFQRYWADVGGLEKEAWDWWINNDAPPYGALDALEPGDPHGAGFYDLPTRVEAQDDIFTNPMIDVRYWLMDGLGVVGGVEKKDGTGNHGITIWGFNYEDDFDPPFRGSALQFPRIPFPAGRSGARRSAA